MSSPNQGAVRWLRAECCRILLAVTTALVSTSLSEAVAQNSERGHCLAREGRTSIVGLEDTALYEEKLFVTKDDVARYVFLTNGNFDGDRSVAVYRAPSKKGSLPGGYWVTSTEAPTSLFTGDFTTDKEKPRVNPRSLVIKRADAPIPGSTARVVHALWLKMLKGSPVDERAVLLAPTAIISATSADGVRMKAATVAWGVDPPCIDFSVALMRFGQSLINYPQLPKSQRVEAARKIERESQRMLKRVSQGR